MLLRDRIVSNYFSYLAHHLQNPNKIDAIIQTDLHSIGFNNENQEIQTDRVEIFGENTSKDNLLCKVVSW